MEYKASTAEKFKALIRIAKPDAQIPIAWAIGHAGKDEDPVLFVIRGKPGNAEKGLKKEAKTKDGKSEKVTLINLGLLHYKEGEIILNCRKAPSTKIKTNFIEYFDKCKNSTLSRHITLVPPGEWKDDATDDEALGDDEGEVSESEGGESQPTEQEEPAQIDLAELQARQQKLADFLRLAAANIKAHPELLPVVKEAAQKSADAKTALGKEDGPGAETLIVEAEALVQQLAKAAPPPPPGGQQEQVPPEAPPEQPASGGALKAYIDQQVAELIALAQKQHALVGGDTGEKKPDYTIFSRALSRHLPANAPDPGMGGKGAVDTDVARLKLMIADGEKLEQLLGLKSAEKDYKAPTAKVWADARKAAMTKMDALKQQIKADFGQDAAKIDEGFKPIDGFFTTLDNKLADELETLQKATEAAKKEESQKKARKLVDSYRSELELPQRVLAGNRNEPVGDLPQRGRILHPRARRDQQAAAELI